MISVFSASLQHEITAISLSPGQQSTIISQSGKLAGITIPSTFDAGSRELANQAIATSFVSGYRWSMGICAVLALLACSICLIVLPKNPEVRPEAPGPDS
jgi:hypothetical protein